MKKLFMISVLFSFLLMSVMASAQSGNPSGSLPPINQALIPEGFFAIKLAEALNLGPVETEEEAEATLTSLDITPRNGWIARYPITPDVLIELQAAAAIAADSRKLTMDRDDAKYVVQRVATDLGLPAFTAGDPDGQAGSEEDYGEDSDPSVIDNYYYDEGPPVVTYYPPAPDYDYLYAWVPSPFWVSGYFFPGFFVLNNFQTIVVVHKKRMVCTNHVIDPRTRRIAMINPVTRTFGRNVSSASNLAHRGFHNAQDRNGASAIFNRSVERPSTTNSNKGVVSRTSPPTAPSRVERPAGTGIRPSSGSPIRLQAPVSHEAPPRMPASPSRNSSAPPTTGQGSFGGKGFEGPHGGGSSLGGGCRGRC